MTEFDTSSHEDQAGFLWDLVGKLDEERTYPRLPIDSIVEFRTTDGTHCHAKAVNISTDGIQVRTNVATAQMMHPKGGRITQENAPKMLAMVNLKLKDGEQELAIESHISYLTTVYEEPRCVIGIRFDNIDASIREVLDRYFMEQMSVYFAA